MSRFQGSRNCRATFVLCGSCALLGTGTPCAPACAGQDDPITTALLLAEMIDRETLARYPDPAYTCRQFSSYDRAATSPDENWPANGDASQYLRTEEHDSRTEWVMMDADGPGAVVRNWSANPPGDGTMRLYLDGSDEPVIAAPMADVLGGRWRVSSPLSAVRSRGWNLYTPIPYARHSATPHSIASRIGAKPTRRRSMLAVAMSTGRRAMRSP